MGPQTPLLDNPFRDARRAPDGVRRLARVAAQKQVPAVELLSDETFASRPQLATPQILVRGCVVSVQHVAGHEHRIVVDEDVREPGGQKAVLLHRQKEIGMLDLLEARIPWLVTKSFTGRHEEVVNDVEYRQAVDLSSSRSVPVHVHAVHDVHRAFEMPDASARPIATSCRSWSTH